MIPSTAVPPCDALEILRVGNARFTSLRPPTPAESPGPPQIAVVVCCSDLHPPPESIFGVGFGDLLVAQTPGLHVALGVAATVEYGVRVLGIGLVVLLAHEGCPLLESEAGGLPETVVERHAVGTIAKARRDGVSVARTNALRESVRLHELIDLPPRALVAPAVLHESGRVELL